MKLMYLTNGVSSCGGLERVLCIKTQHFIEEMQHEVAIIRLNEEGVPPFFEFHNKISFYDINLKYKNKIIQYFLYIQEVSRIVKEYQPDIFFVCDDGVKGLFLPLWLKTSAKLVYERHASLSFNNKPTFFQKLMRKAVSLYDAFVVLTPSCKQDWGGQNNIYVIANPLGEIPELSSALIYKRAICVGNLSYNKGYDLLIEALAKIKDLDWKVDIYGRGDQGYLSQKALRLGISSLKLQFKGENQKIDNEYRYSDFLILPSRTEGFGMVLIEAMAFGVPCIAFDCPNGPRHIIEDKVNGFLAKPEDIEDLARKIKNMLEISNIERQQMGFKAKSTSRSYFIDKIADDWQQLFSKLVS